MIRVIGGQERIDAAAQQARLVLRGDDDRDEGPADRVADLLRPWRQSRPDLGGDAEPVEMLLHGPDVCGVVGRSRRRPAVVQHQRNMANAVGFLDNAQGQVVGSRRAECGPKAADFPHQPQVERREVSDEVHGAEGFRRPVRLEERIAAAAVAVEGVLVGIDEGGARFGGQRVPQHGNGDGRQHVAGIQHGYEVVRDGLQGRVPGVDGGGCQAQSPIRIALSIK